MTDAARTATAAPAGAGWQLDAAGARAYEQFLVAAVLGGWAEELVDAVGVSAGERVLDVGCGTGAVTRHVVARVGRAGTVIAIDRNAAMLAVARDVVARDVVAGDDRPVTWLEADAVDLPVPDASTDVVLCQQALQFVADPATALAEMRRVLVPGGRLGISTCRDLTHQPGYRVLIDVLGRHVPPDAVDVITSVYALGDPDELARLVAAAGFGDVHRRIELTTFRVPSAEALLTAETSSSPLGPLRDRLDADAYGALVDDLAAAMAPHTDDDGVVFPFETLVVTGRR